MFGCINCSPDTHGGGGGNISFLDINIETPFPLPSKIKSLS